MKAPAVLLALALLHIPGVVRAQDSPSSPSRPERASLQKRIAELERQLAVARQEAQALRKELRGQPQLAPIGLVSRDAVEVARILRGFLAGEPSVAVTADQETNYVFVQASAATIQQVKEMVERLDNVQVELRVISLEHVEAAQAARMLKALLGDDDLLRVVPDGEGKRVILSGSRVQVRRAEEMVRQLDVDLTGSTASHAAKPR